MTVRPSFLPSLDHRAIGEMAEAEPKVERFGAFVFGFYFKAQARDAQRLRKGKKLLCEPLAAEGGAQVDLVDPQAHPARLARVRLLQQRKARRPVAVQQQIPFEIGVGAHHLVKGVEVKIARNVMFHGGGGIKFFGHGDEIRPVLCDKFAYHADTIPDSPAFVNESRADAPAARPRSSKKYVELC